MDTWLSWYFRFLVPHLWIQPNTEWKYLEMKKLHWYWKGADCFCWNYFLNNTVYDLIINSLHCIRCCKYFRGDLKWMGRSHRFYANTAPFHIKILSIHRFWYLRRFLKPTSLRYPGMPVCIGKYNKSSHYYCYEFRIARIKSQKSFIFQFYTPEVSTTVMWACPFRAAAPLHWHGLCPKYTYACSSRLSSASRDWGAWSGETAQNKGIPIKLPLCISMEMWEAKNKLSILSCAQIPLDL